MFGGLTGAGGGGGDSTSQLMTMMMTMEASLLMSQSSPGQMSDMSSLCNNFGNLTNAGANANTSISTACDRAKSQCSKSCANIKRIWADRGRSMADRCGNKKLEKQRVDSTYEELATIYVKCDKLSANNNARVQANNYSQANQNAMRNVCSQLAQQNQQPPQLQPVSMQQQVDCTNPVQAQMYSSACTACAQANNGEPCPQAILDSGGKGTFQATNNSAAANNLNVSSSADQRMQQSGLGVNGGGGQSNMGGGAGGAGANQPGMGGGFGGGFGAGMAAAQGLQPQDPGVARRYGAPAAYHTDILNGERSGGYSSPIGGSMEVDTSNGFKGYGTGDPANAKVGLDLKRYLPGNDHYVGRRQVAGVGTANPDINTFTTDIFKRISDRFKVICSMNRLVDCNFPKQPN